MYCTLTNVKALLTACGHQKMLFALFEGAWGVAPATAVASPVLNALWKGQPHGLPKLQSVTNRDGGDNVLGLAAAHQKPVTVVAL